MKFVAVNVTDVPSQIVLAEAVAEKMAGNAFTVTTTVVT